LPATGRTERHPPPRGPPYQQVNAAVNNLVIAQTGLAYEAYLRLKLTTVLERMAEAAARLSDYPADSSHASFVRSAILVWGTREGLLPAENVSGAQVAIASATRS
jgi:hypothetical protein